MSVVAAVAYPYKRRSIDVLRLFREADRSFMIKSQAEDTDRFEPSVQQHIHLCGGLRCRREEDGWFLGPWRQDGGTFYAGPILLTELPTALEQFDVRIVGHDERLRTEPFLTQRLWHASKGLGEASRSPGDIWGSVSYQAGVAGDKAYASLARYLSISLGAIGIRLRDLSDGYGVQLLAALESRKEVGARWSNIGLREIHLAAHSLLLELICTRDYLARIVGFQIGAPENADSLPRLVSWIEKKDPSLAEKPAVSALTRGWTSGNPRRWLFDLSEHRNEFTHRYPLSATDKPSMMTLVSHECAQGIFSKLAILDNIKLEGLPHVDLLEYLLHSVSEMNRLSFEISEIALYKPVPKVFDESNIIKIERIEVRQHTN